MGFFSTIFLHAQMYRGVKCKTIWYMGYVSIELSEKKHNIYDYVYTKCCIPGKDE